MDAVSFAASVALLAVDSNRAVVRPTGSLAERLKTVRETFNDMLKMEVNPKTGREYLRRIVGRWSTFNW